MKLFVVLFVVVTLTCQAQVRTVFRDNFDNLTGWQKVNGAGVAVEIRSDELAILKPSGSTPFKLIRSVPLDMSKDFIIQVPFEVKAGGDNDQFGVIFGGGDSIRHFAFLLTPSGKASLHKFGAINAILGKAKDVGRGDTSTNVRLVEVAKIGDVVGCYVDGINAGYLDLPYNPVYGNMVGLYVSKGVRLNIDYFDVRERPARDIRSPAGHRQRVQARGSFLRHIRRQ